MKTEARYYDVRPKVVPADQQAVIEIRPRYDAPLLQEGVRYRVSYFPTEEFALQSGWPNNTLDVVEARGGVLHIPRFFEGEQEHVLVVERLSEGRVTPLGDFRVYSLGADLFTRRPYKGDIHLHSYCSDGRESPAYVAAACRREGLDFMAVTDHGKYAPSIEARQAFEGLPINLAIFPGEEIHPPGNPVHMINFGGSYSINALFVEDRYRDEVAALERGLGSLPAGVDSYQYASCCWCFDEIRRAGGLGVFCHPYWFTEHRYTPSGALTSYLFEQQPYDAFELIGGYHRFEVDSNTLQVARYHDERARGARISIVGVSDAHGCDRGELFGWYYTIAFAPSLSLDDLKTSITELYSVAVEALPGETPRAYGPFRLVKYALFLMREVLLRHDELCYEEGQLMFQHLAGSTEAAERLRAVQGRTAAYYGDCWGM